jgi:hypothetical protein
MKFNFLIADEIRAEISGKQTVLGLYPDNTLLLENHSNTAAPGQPEAIERLTVLINISEAPGEHNVRGWFVDPSGNPAGEQIEFGRLPMVEDKSCSLVIQAKPFIISEIGTYHFNLYVNDVLYQFPFNIKRRESDQS